MGFTELAVVCEEFDIALNKDLLVLFPWNDNFIVGVSEGSCDVSFVEGFIVCSVGEKEGYLDGAGDGCFDAIDDGI